MALTKKYQNTKTRKRKKSHFLPVFLIILKRRLVLFAILPPNVHIRSASLNISYISTRCRWNCGPRLVMEERFTLDLEINCPDCSEDELLNIAYTWKVLKVNTKTDAWESLQWNNAMFSSKKPIKFVDFE